MHAWWMKNGDGGGDGHAAEKIDNADAGDDAWWCSRGVVAVAVVNGNDAFEDDYIGMNPSKFQRNRLSGANNTQTQALPGLQS